MPSAFYSSIHSVESSESGIDYFEFYIDNWCRVQGTLHHCSGLCSIRNWEFGAPHLSTMWFRGGHLETRLNYEMWRVVSGTEELNSTQLGQEVSESVGRILHYAVQTIEWGELLCIIMVVCWLIVYYNFLIMYHTSIEKNRQWIERYVKIPGVCTVITSDFCLLTVIEWLYPLFNTILD